MLSLKVSCKSGQLKPVIWAAVWPPKVRSLMSLSEAGESSALLSTQICCLEGLHLHCTFSHP